MKRDLLTGAPAYYSRRINFAPTHKSNRHERRRFKNDGAAGGGASLQQQNARAEALVLAVAQPMVQQTYQGSINGTNTAQGSVLNIPLNNVGLNTRITVEISGTIAVAAAETLKATPWGIANLLSNIQLTDLNNYQRINTSGWHLFLLDSLRRQANFGAAYLSDSPVQMGSNYPVVTAPKNVTAADGAIPFRMFYELPLAYHDNDLRGAIYAAVTNATWRLQLTFNQNAIVGSGVADPTLACYQSTTANDVGSLVVNNIAIYQHYLDQLPPGPQGVTVPLLSLAWNYLIQNTTQTALVQGQDFPTQYANMRTFLSTAVIFNNAGTLNAGSDVNYWGVQAANLVFLEKYDPYMASLRVRNLIGADFPAGTYLFDHRRKPIVTNQFGNTQLVLNASQVNAGASLLIGYEMLAIQSQAINAGSLAAS